jgi:hephaestin
VSQKGPGPSGDRVRTHYIAADEITWEYAPAHRNLLTGRAFGDEENVFVARGRDRIGSRYRKAVYREYRDASFAERKSRPAADRYLGLLGPVIRAEVGDTVRVVFRNNLDRPASVHPHGLRYGKDAEGAGYADGTAGADRADDAIAPGATHTYEWRVPERSGPGPHDPSSVMWMYMSHVDEVADSYAALMGPIVVTRRGAARADGSPKDVDRELVAVFQVLDENASPYLAENVRRFARSPRSVDTEDEAFVESNLMHAINGFVYGNGPVPRLRAGSRVRWHLMGMGTEVDLHTPHWHGNTVTAMGMRMDVSSLLPGSMATADMKPDARGTWLLHCHVNDHITAGMAMRYSVASRG